MDREKVIKGLECCQKKVCIYKDTEKDCPYWEQCGEYEEAFEDCTSALAKDALALLKAQEPVEPSWRRGIPFCGKCGRQFGRGFKYCPDCGRAVKWK